MLQKQCKKSCKIPKHKGRQYNGQKKKDNHWSTKHFPHSDIIFHRKQKSDFYFLDIKKISNFPSNFYHKFLVENCRAGLMIFLYLSCQFILFLYKTQTGYMSPYYPSKAYITNNMIYIISIYIQGFYFLNETSACEMDN